MKAEGVAPTEGTTSLSGILATPKEVVTFVEISRKLLSARGADLFVRNVIRNAVEAKVESLLASGAGGDEPQGLIGTSNVGTFSGAGLNGNAISDAFDDMTTANPQRASWIIGSSPYAKLSNRDVDAATGIKIMRDDKLGGRPVFCSPNVGPQVCMLGQFERFVIVVFGNGLDIVVNPYSRDTERIVRITCRLYMDVAVLEPGAFTLCTDFS